LVAWKVALKDWNMQESQFVLELQAAAKRESLKMVLEERFGPLPADLAHHIDAITDLKRLDQLLRAAVHVNKPEELPL
jgi:hypothetical protein